MPINEYFQPATFTPLDPSFLLRAKAYNQEQNEKAKKSYEDAFAEFNKVLAVPGEEGKRNELLRPYIEGSKTWVDKYANNPSQGIPELTKLFSDFRNNFNYGPIGAVHQAGKSFYETSAQIDKMDQEGKLAGMGNIVRDQLLYKPTQNYLSSGGSQEVSSGSGVYTKPSFGQPFELKDLGKEIRDLVDTWEKTDQIIDFGAGRTGQLQKTNAGYLIRGTSTTLDDKVVTDAAIRYLYANPSYARQIDLMSSFNEDQINRSYPNARVGVDSQGNKIKVADMMAPPNEFGIPGGPVSKTIPFGADLTKEQLREMASIAAMKEKGLKLNIDYLYDQAAAQRREIAARKEDEAVYTKSPVTEAVLSASANVQRTANAGASEAAALLGIQSVDQSTGEMPMNLRDRKILFTFGTSGATSAEDIKAAGYIDAMTEYKALAKRVAKDKSITPESLYDDATRKLLFPEYPPDQWDMNTDPATGKVRFIRKDATSLEFDTPFGSFGPVIGEDYIVSNDEWNERVAKLSDEYKALTQKYKAQYGIDINDPDFIKQVEQAAKGSEGREIVQKIATGFQGMNISVPFSSSQSNTIVIANDGKPYVNGTARFKAGDLLAKISKTELDYLVENGLASPINFDKQNKATEYAIQISTPATANLPSANQDYWQDPKNVGVQDNKVVVAKVTEAESAQMLAGMATAAQNQYQREIETGDPNVTYNEFVTAIDGLSLDPTQKTKLKQTAKDQIQGIQRAAALGDHINKLKWYAELNNLGTSLGLIK